MLTLTFDVDNKVIARARANARTHGIELEQFLQAQIERLAGADQRAREAEAYLASAGLGSSRGVAVQRSDLQRRGQRF